MRKTVTPFLNLLMRLGISAWGSRVLEHRGRRSGTLHHTPVNLLTLDDKEYLVAARGETEWVRNVRAADGNLTLILGRHRQARTAAEVPVEARAEILRAYLRRWKFEVGMFFEGVGPDSTRRRVRSHRRATPGVRPALSTAQPVHALDHRQVASQWRRARRAGAPCPTRTRSGWVTRT